MSRATPRRLRLLLAAVAVLGIAAWFARDMLFEKVETPIDRGFRGEAAYLELYAFQEMLETLDVPTRHTARLRDLPPTDHVLWLATKARNAPVGRILQWVESGGHLVVHPVAGADLLLETIEVATFDQWEADDDDHESRSAYASERPDWPRVYSASDAEDVVVRADGAADAAWFLTVTYGNGAVTVLADAAFLANDNIARLDHALIGWTLAALDGPPAGVLIVYRDPQPSVWALLTARAWPVAVSLLVLALAGLLFTARRFGPPLESVSRDRRRLSEHIRASGSFLWATSNEDRLLASTRDALRARFGRGRTLADDALATVATRTGTDLDEGFVRAALDTREMRDPRRFTKIIRTLELLRRSP